MSVEDLLQEEIKVINIGIREFFDALISQEVDVIHVNWKPPAQGDPEMQNILSKLL
jgi:hypothetical protein